MSSPLPRYHLDMDFETAAADPQSPTNDRFITGSKAQKNFQLNLRRAQEASKRALSFKRLNHSLTESELKHKYQPKLLVKKKDKLEQIVNMGVKLKPGMHEFQQYLIAERKASSNPKYASHPKKDMINPSTGHLFPDCEMPAAISRGIFKDYQDHFLKESFKTSAQNLKKTQFSFRRSQHIQNTKSSFRSFRSNPKGTFS